MWPPGIPTTFLILTLSFRRILIFELSSVDVILKPGLISHWQLGKLLNFLQPVKWYIFEGNFRSTSYISTCNYGILNWLAWRYIGFHYVIVIDTSICCPRTLNYIRLLFTFLTYLLERNTHLALPNTVFLVCDIVELYGRQLRALLMVPISATTTWTKSLPSIICAQYGVTI